MEEKDLVIVGSGPTGLFATFCAGLRQINSVTLESLDLPGGQMRQLYPEKFIYDIAGIPKKNAIATANDLYTQALELGGEIKFNSRVSDIISREDGRFDLEVNGQKQYTAKAVLIATGIGLFTPNTLNIPGEAQYTGSGVYYTVQSLNLFSGKKVLIIGGGDSAFDWSREILPMASSIAIVEKNAALRAVESTTKAVMSDPKTKLFVNSVAKEIIGNGQIVTAATLHNTVTNEDVHVDCDEIIIAIGHKTQPNAFKSLKIENNGRCMIVNDKYTTNMKGIFAAGDISCMTTEPRAALLAVDFAEAYTAINNIKKYINPDASFSGGHSSNLKL